jgi:hypothetical protein
VLGTKEAEVELRLYTEDVLWPKELYIGSIGAPVSRRMLSEKITLIMYSKENVVIMLGKSLVESGIAMRVNKPYCCRRQALTRTVRWYAIGKRSIR